MFKRLTILMLLMALFVPWTAKAQETKTIQVAPDRGGNRGTMTVYKRVSSPTSGRNYLIVSSATANSDALALSQTSSTNENITAAFVHINSGISATSNAVYIANLADPTAVWKASSGWTFSHSKNGTNYYIYTSSSYYSSGSLSANTTATNWDWSNNQLSYTASSITGLLTRSYYITPSSSGFSIGTSAANVYLYEETSVTAYDVTASVSPSGIGRVTGAGQYPAGGTCTLTASTFNSEYTFSNWTVNGAVVSTSPTYSFTVNEDLDVVANFESSVTCPSPTDLTAGTPYAHSVPLTWTSSADNFNVRYRTIGAGETQTFFDGFENGLGNWTIIRDGGGTDATDWKQGPDRDNLYAHTGSYVAESRSWNTTAYSVDNWLITPQVTLDGILRFWAYGNGSYPDHYDVYVSTTGNHISDFSLFYEPAPVTSSWTEVTVDLSSFNGVSGYIALRHTDADKEYLMIDDFGIYAQSYGDWSQLVPANGTTFTLTGLESQTQYQAQVQANCGYELSGWSNNVNFTTTTPSTATPTNLAVDINSITAHSATMSWQGVDANDSHQYYQVYYAESDVNSVPYSPAAPNLIDSITETTYTLSGLTSETEYHVWVRDYCGEDGYSAWTSYQTFTTAIACPSPTNVTVSDVTAHSATIEWIGNGDSYQYYQVYYTDSNVTIVPDPLAVSNLIDSIAEATYTLSGLASETEYHVWVRAYCGEDGYSAWTSYQTFTTAIACPTPTDVTVSDVTAHGATIEWVGSGDSYQFYQLYYADSNVTVVPDSLAVSNLIDSIAEATYTLSGLASETEYHVWVRAYCGEDGYSDWTSYQSFTTAIACPDPTDVTVSDVTAHSATIEWVGNGDSYQFYQLYYSDSNVTVVPDSLVVSNLIDSIAEAAYTLSGLISETDYHVWVRAYCGEYDGYSAWTSYQSFTTAIACPAPTDVTVSDVTAHGATIEWVGNGDSYQFYQVYYADTTVTIVPDSLVVSNLIDSIAEAAYTLSGLYPEMDYHVWVRAYCGEYDGYSDWTSYQSFTTAIACPAPTDVTVSDVTAHGATIEWVGSGDSYQFYQVYYADTTVTVVPDSLVVSNLIDSIAEAAYTLSGLISETDYHVWVRAYCGEYDGYSDWTSYQSFTTAIACPAPTDVTVSDVTAHGATIEWVGNGDSYQFYQVYYADTTVTIVPDSLVVSNLIDSIAEAAYTLSGLISETDYHVWVRAYCGEYDGYSAWTSYQSFTTAIACPAPTDVTVSDVTAHGATIEWVGNGDSYQFYQVYYADTTVTVVPDSLVVSNLIDSIAEATYTLSGLISETDYHVWVRAYCGEYDGYSAWTSYQSFTTAIACPAPTDVTVSDVTAHGATIEWVGNGDSYQFYQVYYADTTVTVVPDSLVVSNLIDSIAEAAYTLSGLISETDYHVWVRAYCGEYDGYSAWTSYQSFTTAIACPAPTDVTVSDVTAHGATIEWVGSEDSYQFYQVYYADTTVTVVPDSLVVSNLIDSIAEAAYTLSGLISETDYHVWVRAYCGEYDGYSAWTSYQSFTTAIACPAPTDVTVSDVTAHGATIEWVGSGDSYQFYQVYYADTTVTVVPDSLVVSNLIDSIAEATYTLSGLYPEMDYHVWVRAYCGEYDGYSDWTSYQSFTTAIACPVPTDLTVSDVTAHGATIEWVGSGDSYQFYQVYYADTTVTVVPDSLVVSNLIDSIAEATYTLSGLYPEMDYHVWVRAYCGEYDGYSDWTSYQSFTTAIACPAPTDLTVVENSITSHGATIAWNGTSEGYNVILGTGNSILLQSVDFSDEIPSTWINDDTYPWTIVDGHIQSGNTGVANSSSTISVIVSFSADGIVEFDAECMGEGTSTYYDHCDFNIDGVTQLNVGANISGWNHYTFDVTAGLHTLTWSYTKDSSVNPTGDYFAIDNVVIKLPSVIDWEDPIYAESTEYTFTGLTSETTYFAKVQSNCGEDGLSPETDIVTFTTEIACPTPSDFAVVENSVTSHEASIAWNGNSEGYNVILGIENDNLIQSANFSDRIPSTWINDDTYPWTIVDSHIQSGNTGIANSSSTISVFVSFPADGTVEFDAECRGEGTNNNYSDHCDFNIDGIRFIYAGENISGWNHYTYEVTAGIHTFTWSYTKDGSVNPTGDYFAIDNVVMKMPSTIDWEEPIYTENTEYTFTGLTSETTYYAFVQSSCGEDGLSPETDTITFTTDIACPAPTPLDATEVTSNSAVLNWTGNAESYSVSYYKTFFYDSFEEDLSQWTIYHLGDPESWEWGIENPNDNSAELNAHGGFYAAVTYSDYNIHADNWLVTPQILMPAQTKLKFWVMRSSYDDAQDEYEVLLSTTGNDVSDFTTILQGKTTANSYWTEVSIDLSAYDGQQCYIAIRHDYTDGFFLMVDDFSIFGWSEDIVTTDNSLLIEDLLPETDYLWKVQANCGEEDGLSQWSSIDTVTTLRACPVPFDLNVTDEIAYGATISWKGYSDSYMVMVTEAENIVEPEPVITYDFEDGWQGWTTFQGNTTSPNSWMHNTAYPTSNNDFSTGYGYSNSDGFMLSESYISGASSGSGTAVTPDNYFVSPQVRLGGSISFYAGARNTTYCAEKFSVMVSTTDNTNADSFTTVETWTLSLSQAGYNSTPYTVDLSAYSGMGYIAIRHYDCYDQWFLAIDNVTIEQGSVEIPWITYEADESPFVLNDESNILPETTYFVKVKGICGDEETEESEGTTFTTLDENTKIFVTEGDWSDGDNWLPVGVPSMEQDVILRAEATVFDVAEANAITINDAAALIIEDGGQLKTNTDVEATMKKFIIGYGTDYVETNNGYYLMTLPTAAPIAAADAGLITEESDYDLYGWDRTATDEEWQNHHDGIDLQNGIGFLYSNRDDMEMSFTASLRNSSESVIVTPSYDEVEHGGWNLYGNPFPCEAYITTDAEDMTFYRLIDNELVPIEGAIAPLEAFFVKATAAGQTFTISREAPAK